MTERLPLPEPVGIVWSDGRPHHTYNANQMHSHAAAQSAADNAALSRWKSTNAPRLEALEGLLKHAQIEAAKGAEAIASLASERAANAILTGEVEALRAERDNMASVIAQLLADNTALQNNVVMPLRERVNVLREVVESAAAADVFKDSPGAMDRLAEYARAALEAK